MNDLKSNSFLRTLNAEKVICIIFFVSFFILGFKILDDYGLSWDEGFQRERNGSIVHNFVFHGQRFEYEDGIEKYHGPAIEWPLYTIERILDIKDIRDIYLFRHAATFLMFFASAFFFYLFIRKLYGKWGLALLGTILYIASPRIFADAFYNTKDIGGLSFFTISMFTGLNFLRKPDRRNAIAHGALCGFLIAIRITGIIVPVITVAVLLLKELIEGIDKLKQKQLINTTLILTGVTIFVMMLFWPILWLNPVHFIRAWREMSHYSWDGVTMFMGHLIKGTELPWNYLPVWIGITTPMITLFLLFTAVIYLLSDTISFKKINKDLYFNNLAILGYLMAPVIAVVVFKSVLYDGWRHLYFINGAIVALACYPVYKLSLSGIKMIRNTIMPIIFICLCPVIFKMVEMHPYQNIYFNKIMFANAGEARFKFELDYWGLSFRKGLEYVIKNDQRDTIKVYADSYPGPLNAKILKPSERKRLVFLNDENGAEYILGNYRKRDKEYTYPNEVFNITVDSAKVLAVYKVK